MGLMGRVKAVFFPNRCILCRSVVNYNLTCCGECEKKLRYNPREAFCGLQSQLCGIAAPLVYEGFVRETMVGFKDIGNKGYAEKLAPLCALAVRECYSGIRFDAVVCVPNFEPEGRPLYNQARVLARALANELELPFWPKALAQIKKKQTQHTLPAALREQNVAGIFGVGGGHEIAGKTLLLTDDIVTTGSTLQSCAEALITAGAAEVYAVAAAYVKSFRSC